MKSANFIIVDDDAINNMMCQLSIARHFGPVKITCYQDPEKALEQIAVQYREDVTPTVLLLDIHMPQMSGWAFLERFAQFPETVKNQFRIYIVSSSIDLVTVEQAERHPLVESFLSKPLGEKKLGKIFRELPEEFGVRCFG